ncbi:hypothetical protein GOBAR_DD08296 [Gossypium barbadense]|nr:hypothetical protein GOBAR_DD08296 [Gossypium barbadense]
MAKRGLVIPGSEERYEAEGYCEFHREVGHEIQECEGFKALVQSMMDNKEMRFYEEVEDKRNICASELAMKTTETSHPVVIISCPRSDESREHRDGAAIDDWKGGSPGKGLGKSEDIGEVLKDVHINAIETSEKRALLEICPYEPGSELNN